MNNKTIKIELSLDECQLVLAGLSELPLKVSMEVAMKFKQQCEEQIKAAEEEVKE